MKSLAEFVMRGRFQALLVSVAGAGSMMFCWISAAVIALVTLRRGAGHGAWGAQFNAWEALAIFAAANLIAFMGGVDPAGDWSMAAIIWLVVRFFHGIFYIANIPVLRILCFATGLAMSLWIVTLAM